MKKILFSLLVITGGMVSAQQRYIDKVFTSVNVTTNVTYGTNIDFLTSDLSDQAQVGADITAIKTALLGGQPIPSHFYDPADTVNSKLKVTDVKMDVYEPAGDSITDRPLVIYIHTGNFLPPPLNGSPTGRKEDSTAVHVCKEWAKRGYVAIALSYRLGWNPIAGGPSGAAVRRGTLLNAVYRAIHDVKQGVRTLKADAAASNTYGIDASKIILYGQGSGGYVALAYATMDKYAEISITKFINPFSSTPYVDTATVGNLEGTNGLLNLYVDNGMSTDINFVVNAGGALADTSWLEAGDAPMVSFHCVRDPFAPFNEGTVRVPTTLEDVVDVQGAGVFMAKANSLNNNSSYQQGFTYNDAYTVSARAKYGNTYSYIYPAPFDKITVSSDIEGVFPILRAKGATQFQNEGSPWDWWNPNDPISQAVVDAQTGATAHMAGLQSNPDMSPTKGKTYVDTIMGYAAPRVSASLQLNPVGLNEQTVRKDVKIYPNPVSQSLNLISLDRNTEITAYTLMDVTGKVHLSAHVDATFDGVLDVSILQKGVYILQVNTNKGAFAEKIMKD